MKFLKKKKTISPGLGSEPMTVHVKSSCLGITFFTGIGISTNDPIV